MKQNKTLQIIITVISIVVVAALGSVFVNLGMDWFNSLNKPTQWIPNIIIPIVWSVIYLTFAVILWLIIEKYGYNKKLVILLIINGVLNVLWCLTFFTLNLTFVGNIVIILNLIFAYILVNEIFKINPIYGWITFIYPVWVSIATTLNTALWILN